MLVRQLHFLKRLAAQVSVRRLSFPRSFNLLPAVQEAILKDLEGGIIQDDLNLGV
jgi:hypothetical protein